MDTAKFIRTLGYIMYVLLWSPVIVVGFVGGAIWWFMTNFWYGAPMKETAELWLAMLNENIEHDKNFIRTGIW